MEPRRTSDGEETNERRNIRRNLVRRAGELAMIHGRAHEPTREDVQQAKREIKPLKLSYRIVA